MATTFKSPCHCCEQIQVTNRVATKEWYGFQSPGDPQRCVESHGTRYLSMELQFSVLEFGVPWGGLNASLSIGRYSGCWTAATYGFTDHNPLGFMFPQRSITGYSVSATGISITFDDGQFSGTFVVGLSNPYTLADLKADCRELLLMADDIVGMPPDSVEFVHWQPFQTLPNSDPAFFCAIDVPLPAEGCFLADCRTIWPIVDPASNTVQADQRVLLKELDTSGIAFFGSFAEMAQDAQGGDWVMCDAYFRHLPPRNCIKSRVRGVARVSGSIDGNDLVTGPVKSNVVTCFNKDAPPPAGTLHLDSPDIIIDDDNIEVEIDWDMYPSLVASDGNPSCDCVSKPQPPFNVQVVTSGSVLVLTWETTATDHDINVDIYRGESSGSEGFLETWGTSNQYVDALVTTGHTYFYRLKARNAFGVSDWSAEVNGSL